MAQVKRESDRHRGERFLKFPLKRRHAQRVQILKGHKQLTLSSAVINWVDSMVINHN